MRQLETTRQSLEQSFVLRVRRFAEWLAEQMQLQQSGPRDMAGHSAPPRDNSAARSNLFRRLSELLHPAYVLTAGLVFHKILERSHDTLPTLERNTWPSKADFQEAVRHAFSQSGRLAPGFTPLFLSAAEAVDIIPDTQRVLTGIRTFLEELEGFPLERIELGTVDTAFESLIPRVERHQLGQFYTPAPIAEVLVRWAVRRPVDQVLDPACGAGIILAKACAHLRNLEKRHSDQSFGTACGSNNFVQLYGLDIDPTAIRLAAASLAMQGFGSRFEAANFMLEDFFSILPLDATAGEDSNTRKWEASSEAVSIPLVDAVVTNPPYTRWSELPRTVRTRIQTKVGDILRAYHLSPRRGWGVEAGLHIYFALWAHRFLRSGGRLAMIVSDSWLQTDFGTAFGQFLLDHFMVRAVVDLGARVFSAPLVGACLLLLEREDDSTARAANRTRFISFKDMNGHQHFGVEHTLQAIDGVQWHSPNITVREVTQQRIPRDSKWIQNFFDVEACHGSLQRSSLMTRLESLCDVAYGNATYLVLASKGVIRGVPNAGGEGFFYLSDRDAQTSRLSPPWINPLLPSGRYAHFFHFTKMDWEGLRTQGVRCWLFTAHAGRRLPRSVMEYIRRGETVVKLRRMQRSEETAKTVSESFASHVRRGHPQYFRGWFDLGDTQPAPIFAIRGTQHRPRFVLTDFAVGLDDRLIAIIPKVALDEEHLKALAAALNSTFTQFQIEATCRSTGGGMVELDLRHTAGLLIPDVTQLPSETVTVLAKLFQRLEQRARWLGGAEGKAQLDALASLFREIDRELAATIGMAESELRCMQALARTLARRRVSRVRKPLTM